MNKPETMDVFIVAITAPTPSNSYTETSCTAGFDKHGKWIRIYPVPLRMLSGDKKYRKYQWVQLDTFLPANDKRPESRKCNYDSIKIISERVGTRNNWQERKKLCLYNGQKIYTDFEELLSEALADPIKTSLAVFKPKRILKCTAKDISEKELHEILSKQASIKSNYQPELNFTDEDREFIQAQPPRVKLKYQFLDSQDKKHELTILDWEAYMLYYNLINDGNSHEIAKDKLVQKYSKFISDCDVYLFLGTRYNEHMKRYKQPFSIIGVFYPKKDDQLTLF